MAGRKPGPAKVRNDIDELVRKAAAAQGCASVAELARRMDVPYRTLAGWQETGRIAGPMRLLVAMLAEGIWRLPPPAATGPGTA